MSFGEGITFDDELALIEAGIDPGDHSAPEDDDETQVEPFETMAEMVAR